MIIEVSIGIIAVAFVILVVYLVYLTNALRVTLKEVDHTLLEGRKQFVDLAISVKRLVYEGDKIGRDIDEKINALNPFFRAIENVGDVVEYKTASLRNRVSERAEPLFPFGRFAKERYFSRDARERKYEYAGNGVDRTGEIVKDVLALTAAGVRLWQNVKRGR